MKTNGLFFLVLLLGIFIGIVIGIMIAGYSIGVTIKGFMEGMNVQQVNFNLNETKLVETAFNLGNWSNVTG